MRGIRELVKELASAEIPLGEARVPARALSASETDVIAGLLPRPVSKVLKKDPAGGTLAKVPDEDDPAFRVELKAWVRLNQCVQLAASCGLGTADGWDWESVRGGAAEAARAWCEKVAEEMRGAFTAPQIERAFLAVRDLIDDGRVRAAVLAPAADNGGEEPGPEAFTLPARYGIPAAGVFLRICERYGMSPFAACGVGPDDPGMWALLVAQERVRQAEETGGAGS